MNVYDIHDSHDRFKIIETTARSQSATIRLGPGEATSEEMSSHEGSDQTVVVVEGTMVADLDGDRQTMRGGDSVTVVAGTKHRFRNESEEDALAFTVYSPPAYPSSDSEAEHN